MSHTKRALPEDFSILTGQELDTSPVLTDEPSLLDWTMNDLHNSINCLQTEATIAVVYELKAERDKLTSIIEKLEKPF